MPGPPGLDFLIQNRLNKLKEGNENINNSKNFSLSLHHHLHYYQHNHHFHSLPLPYPHHHFIVHNDMFHQQNHLYLPAGSFKLLPPPPFSPTDHFFWVSCNDKRKKEEEKEKIKDEIDDKMYKLPDLQNKS